MNKLKVKKLFPYAIIPKYATKGAACFDLHGGDDIEESTIGISGVIGTGLAFEIPEGHVMLIFSRSGHGFRDNIRLANCVGVIDSDYRGEVRVKLTNDYPAQHFQYKRGDRIAQAMVVPVQQVEFEEVSDLSDTERGQGGFGSTGQ